MGTDVLAVRPQADQAGGWKEISYMELVAKATQLRNLVTFHNRLRDSKLPMFETIVARTWTMNTQMAHLAALIEQVTDWADEKFEEIGKSSE
jgi:hypothetical protein